MEEDTKAVEAGGKAMADFNVFVGSVNGLLKGININGKGAISKNLSKMVAEREEQNEITCMSFDGNEGSILLGAPLHGSW